MQKYKHYEQPSFSIFIVVSLVTVISIISLSLTNVIKNSLEYANDGKESLQAKYAVKSAMELAQLELKPIGPGFETGSKDSPKTRIIESNGITQGQASWYISTLANKPILVNSTSFKIIPTVGYGDAYKSQYEARYRDIFQSDDGKSCKEITGANTENWENECNWYKLEPGEAVALPLYTETPDSNGNLVLKNPKDLNLTKIRIIVRAACKTFYPLDPNDLNYDEDKIGECKDRYKINSDFNNKVVVSWIVLGTCNGQSCSGGEKMALDSHGNVDENYDSRIRGININNYNASDFQKNIIREDSSISTNDLKTPKLIDFLNNIQKPILQLASITGLYSNDGIDKYIPYLEYQIQIASSNPFPDRYERIYAIGSSGYHEEKIYQEISWSVNKAMFSVMLGR
jgi:hypothetical protein